MSKAPATQLGNYVRIRTGKLDANANDPNGDYPFFTCAIEPLSIASYSYDCECVLIAGNGDLNVKYYDGKFDAYQRTYIVESLNQNTLDVRYLYHFLSTYVHKLREMSIGGVIKYIKLNYLTDALIPLPPLPEQKRIAAILDKADAIRRKRQQAVKLTEELLRSVFLDMFGDPVTNPKGWQTRAFVEVCETRLGKMLDSNQQTGEHLRPYLRNSNVQWDQIETSNLEQMDFNEKDRKTFSLNDGDVLICEGGEVGRAAIWRNQLTDCYFQKAIHRARPNQSLALPEYVMFWLWFMSKNGGFKDHVTSATIAHLTGEKLKEIQMALPPIAMQHKFLQVYNSLSVMKTSTNKHLEQTAALFSSILKHAFMGEL